MQVSNSTLQRFDLTSLSAEHQARAVKFLKTKGREIEVYKDEDGGIVNFWHPESTAQASHFVEFFRVGFSSPNGHMAAVENLARRYAELREDLLQRYQDDQATLYKRLGELNQAFESALHSTVLLPAASIHTEITVIYENTPASVRNRAEQAIQLQENKENIMRYIKESMMRGLDTFFENFIRSIQNQDFQSAFDSSMETAKGGESRSLAEMSFADAIRIKDTISYSTVREDEDGNKTAKLRDINTSFWMISRDESISQIIRNEIAELLGLSVRTTSANIQTPTTTEAIELTYTQRLEQGMMTGTGNGNPNFIGSPIQILNAKLFNLSIAFGEISNQSGTNNSALQRAFRAIVFSLFDDAAVSLHGETANAHELQQARTESRSIAASFIVRFDNEVRTITAQMLRDTRMTRTELAFHEAMAYVFDEVGMVILGGSEVNTSSPIYRDINGNPRIPMSEEEFQRRQIQALLEKARMTAEVKRQWAKDAAKEAERWRKIILIASRIASGGNVPPQDREFLLKHSPGMYMLVRASQVERDNPQRYESVLNDEERSALTSTGDLSLLLSEQAG